MPKPEDAKTYLIDNGDRYLVTAADGVDIGLPWKNHTKVKLPATVTVVVPQPPEDFYYVSIVPRHQAGMAGWITETILNAHEIVLKLASKSLPRTSGYLVLGLPGAIAGAIIGTLFTPSDISKEIKIADTDLKGKKIVYYVMTKFQCDL